MQFVLLIEDDDLVRRGLTRALRFRGLGVLTAASVAEAVAVAKRSRVDAILSDYHLPDGTGATAVRRVRELQFAPAILLTADLRAVPAEDRALFERMHSKPSPMDEIFVSLDKALRRTTSRITGGDAAKGRGFPDDLSDAK